MSHSIKKVKNPTCLEQDSATENNNNPNFLHENKRKKIFTDGIHHCLDLLINNDVFIHVNNDKRSQNASVYGMKMFKYLKQLFEELKEPLVELENSGIKNPETLEDDSSTITPGGREKNIEEENVDNDNDDVDIHAIHKRHFNRNIISYDDKIRIIKLTKKHPTWSVKKLREKSRVKNIHNSNQVAVWVHQHETGQLSKSNKKRVRKRNSRRKGEGKIVDSEEEDESGAEDIRPDKTLDECKDDNELINSDNEISTVVKKKKLSGENLNLEHQETSSKIPDKSSDNLDGIDDYQYAKQLNQDEAGEICQSQSRQLRNRSVSISSTVSLKKVSMKEKKKIVELADKNPQWDVKKLRRKTGCEALTATGLLLAYKKHVKNGGSTAELRRKIDKYVYKKCIYYKNEKKDVSNRLIKKWGLEAKEVFKIKTMRFKAADSWLRTFKKTYNISGNHYELVIGDKPDLSDSE